MLYARDLFAWLEPVLVLLLLVATWGFPAWSGPAFDLLRAAVARLERRGRALAAAFAVGLGGSLLVTLATGLPVPRVADEHSYLLAADLYAQGRLAAPIPPSPAHFEAFFVLVEPTYASKYPPAQGMVLAAGQRLGHPAVALWLGAGVLCAATFWTLRAWLGGGWAMAGAGIVAARIGVASYWSHSYWGGTVAAIGGALLWGAAARIVRGGEAGVGHGVLLGSGAAILATSRPLEGLIVALPAAVWLAGWSLRMARRRRLGRVARCAVPALAVLAATAAGMAMLNHRVTGDPLRLPYAEWEARYATVPNLAGRPLRAIDRTRPVEVVAFYDSLAETYDPSARWVGGSAARDRLVGTASFFWGAGLTLPAAFALGLGLGRPVSAAAASAVLLLLAAQLAIRPWWPHYTAPATVLLALFAVIGLRRLSGYAPVRRGRPVPIGRSLVVGLLLLQPVMIAPQLVERAREQRSWAQVRARISADLEAQPGQDVVFVRYGAAHHPAREWIANPGDIDAAPVLFVRDLGVARNRGLLAALPGRRSWLLEVDRTDRDRPRLAPYDLSSAALP